MPISTRPYYYLSFAVLGKSRELRIFYNTLLRVFGTKRETIRETWRIGFNLGVLCVDMSITLK